MRRVLAAVAVVAAFCLTACGGDSSALPPADARVYDASIPADGALGIDCRGANCAPGDICCSSLEIPPNPSYYCLPQADYCAGHVFSCDGPEDCDGGVCCSDVDATQCVATVADCGPGNIACHLNGDCPFGVCTPTPLGLYGVCR